MRSPEGFEGIFIDVLDEIKRRANLTYTIEASPDDSYGYERPTGNWTGLIGQLQSKKADLAVAPLTVFSKRANIVHFTYPVMSSGLRILYKVPDPWSEREAFSILLSPFTPGLWVVLLLMFIATSVFFYVIGRFSPYEDHAFVGKAATYEGLTLLNSFLYTFTSLTFQGYTAAPRSMAGRFLAAFWWMFVLLVIAAYTASLCAIFLSYKPSILSMPFATFDELSQQTHVAYGIVRGGSTEFYLKNSKRKLEKRLWGTINANSENVMAGSVQEGLHRVHSSNGGYAFITEGPVAEYLSGKPPCTLMTVGEELSEHDYAFACRTETDVCDTINKIIIKLREEDFIYDLKQKWMHQGCQRDDTSEYIFQGVAFFDTFGSSPKYFAERAVTLRRFGTGFLVIFIGIVLSGCILVAEIFYAKRRGTAVPQRLPRTGMDDQQRIDREFRDEDA
ncbi:glutamate receptor-like [Littorina saxatilis]|uniref:glutamate receptor-like n=1 Tax=Littorina saxatilis TaxID=31220 RepID=UPI0038B480EA